MHRHFILLLQSKCIINFNTVFVFVSFLFCFRFCFFVFAFFFWFCFPFFSHLAERRGHLGCVRYLDSSSKHKRADGERDRPGKISRSLSSSNVNKLVRRGSGRRSAKRREISSVSLSLNNK